MFTESTPTLLNLTNLEIDGKPFNIIEKIAALDHFKFDINLLQDENGEAVRVIRKNHKDAEGVVRAIIEKWLAGSSGAPRTYQHLIKCLRPELGAVADLIPRCQGKLCGM